MAAGTVSSSIPGSKVGLIGLGHIGRAVALRLGGWDVHILVFRPLPSRHVRRE